MTGIDRTKHLLKSVEHWTGEERVARAIADAKMAQRDWAMWEAIQHATITRSHLATASGLSYGAVAKAIERGRKLTQPPLPF